MADSVEPVISLLPVPGVSLAACSAGIKYKNRDDLALIAFDKGTQLAAVFTTNKFCAAPVIVAKEHLQSTQPKYLLINSGNANAGTGEQGLENARMTCLKLSEICKCKSEEVIPFSTGVIGKQLEVEKINSNLKELHNNLAQDTWLHAAKAIMTTDTVNKGASVKINLDGQEVIITGICKGSGMIRPDMATMLSYVATNLAITEKNLNELLNKMVDQSFHCITVDGDTSTNDACVLAATGKANVNYENLSDTAKSNFRNTLQAIFNELAQAIVRDGEGATKFISITVEEANSSCAAKAIAFTVAHSPLVKTAAFASDPNWGRVLAAVGRSPVDALDVNKMSMYINELCVIKNGQPASDYTESKGQQVMQNEELTFRIVLGVGNSNATVWTTDLSYDYVKINAEYRT